MVARRRVVAGLLVVLAIAGTQAGSAQTPAQTPAAVNPDAAIIAEFQGRLKTYIALHEKQEGTLPPFPKDATAAQIDQTQRALERLIIAARAGAKPGDVFGPGMPALVRRLLKPAFTGTTGRENRATVTDPDDKTPVVPVKINARYPDSVPLSTMPPGVLEALPDLRASKEHEVKYYFLGRHLILLDVHAHIIVDFIENAMPL
jgi:hypothetical protein